MPVALDIRRLTFRLFADIEWAFAIVLAIAVLLAGTSIFRFVLTSLVIALVTLESFWLRPILDARVTQIIAGATPPSSPIHVIYLGVDVIKLFALLALGAVAAWRV